MRLFLDEEFQRLVLAGVVAVLFILGMVVAFPGAHGSGIGTAPQVISCDFVETWRVS